MRRLFSRAALLLLLLLVTSTTVWAENTYTSYTVTAGIGNTYGDGSNWAKLLENNTESKWCCLLGSGIYVEFNTPDAIIPTGYILTTAEDTQTYPNRNPTAWVLYGKRNQGDAWTLLDSKTNYTSMPASNNTDVSFTFSNSQAYKYFRFEVSAVNGLQNNDQYNNQPAYKFQLAELRLKGNDYVPGNSPTISVEACEGKRGSLYVKGWCEDPDSPNTQLTVEVHILDAQQNHVQGSPIHLTANSKRFGEDNQWHYNGFDNYIPITEAATYKVSVYANDATGDANTMWNGYLVPVEVQAPYTVTFNANGGSGAPAAQMKHYGVDLTLSSIVPTRDGHIFQRWTTTQNGGGTVYSPGAAYDANADATLYAQWVASDFPGSGTAADPYVISTTGQWNLFASNVNNGNSYSGKYFTLGADITVSTMAGTYDTPFSGTFDGRGHTMNIAINGTGTGGGHPNIAVAPFRYVNGATFKDINLTGAVTRNDYPEDSNVSLGGLIGIVWQYRSATIIGCRSSVNVGYSFSWDRTDFITGNEGGFIGWNDGDVTFTDCLYDGVVSGRPKHVGGFVGWHRWGSMTFNNCLENGTQNITGEGWFREYFCGLENSVSPSLNNCYRTASSDIGVDYTGSLAGYAQGTKTSETGETLRAMLGSGWVVNKNDVVVPGKVLTLSADADNSTAIAFPAGAGAVYSKVTLDGYTLHRDNSWNTIVLPFNLPTLTDTPLAGATVKTLASSNYSTQNDGTLTLTFTDATTIESGKPYIVKWTSTGSNIENPVFEDVLISNATANVETTYADFIGNYAPITANGLLLDAHNPDGDAMHAAISIDGPTREGYTIGWYTDAARQTAVTTIPFDENGNVTLYAKWTLNTYTITYNLNGGTNHADNPATYNIGSETITLQEPTKANYIFGGWFDNESCTGDAVTSIVSGSYGNKILYAKWLAGELALANNGNNSDAISAAAASGLYHNVTLTDRTLYKDGDWNSLCLPFALTSFTGTPLEGATVKTLESTAFSNGTLTMNFSNDLTSIEAGKPYIVKWDDADFTIRSSADWNTFVSNVGNYQNKTVKLATDLNVSSMVTGTFKGTLDGCGHTITLSLTSGSSAEEIALFKTLENATIKNLKIAGNITFGLRRPASIASYISGTTTIKNCWSSVNINSNSGTWVDGGAFVARVNDNATFNMSDCLFTGSITFKPEDFQGGGMVGWTQAKAKAINLTNCLFAPSSMTMTKIDGKNETYVFVSGYVRGNLSGCYYNSVVNNVSSDVLKREGTYTTATGSELQALLGDGWEVSGGNVVPKMVPSIKNPMFSDVPISNATANVSTTYVDFVGTYSPVVYNAEDKSVLFLGGGSTLYYPDGKAATTINSCRAYFTLNGITAGDPNDPNAVKGFVLNFGDGDGTETSIRPTPDPSPKREGSAGAWYTIDGRKVSPSPNPSPVRAGRKLPRGIYIHNGKKVVIK